MDLQRDCAYDIAGKTIVASDAFGHWPERTFRFTIGIADDMPTITVPGSTASAQAGRWPD